MPQSSPLPDVAIADDCNYIAAFLTMACPYRCSYCINSFESAGAGAGRLMSAEQWIAALNRLTNLDRPEGLVPVTLQGGEPSVYRGFYDIINGLPERIRIDVLTNLAFDVREMIEQVRPDRLRRDAPYASIRVSYHPDQVQLDELLTKTRRLLDAGFDVGIWGVLHPDQVETVRTAQRQARSQGIDFRTKEFLGFHNGKLYGHYIHDDACSMQANKTVLCRTTEMIIGPDGGVYRCHHDLYEGFEPIGHILDPDFRMSSRLRTCDCYGHCNPCDVKIKTNRLQQFGHTSVTIKFPPEESHESKAHNAPVTLHAD